MISSPSPWQIEDADYPEEENRSAQLEFLVRYAVLAPSTHNSQPWRFRIRGDALELLADRRRALPVCDPDGRELAISCGAALQFGRLAARNMRREGAIELLPDPLEPDLLARLRLGSRSSPVPAEVRRFRAIRYRHTSRMPLVGDDHVDEVVKALPLVAQHYGLVFRAMRDERQHELVAALVADADRELMADPGFRAELARWVRSSASASGDGMSIASFGLPDRLSSSIGAAIRTMDIGKATAGKHKELALATPWVGVLSSFEDEARCWLRTGMALADILLDITAAGLSYSFMNQPIELPTYRSRLSEIAGVDQPQMLMRIGRGGEAAAAARRPAENVIELG